MSSQATGRACCSHVKCPGGSLCCCGPDTEVQQPEITIQPGRYEIFVDYLYVGSIFGDILNLSSWTVDTLGAYPEVDRKFDSFESAEQAVRNAIAAPKAAS